MTNRKFLAAFLLVTACLTGWTCISGSPSVAGPLDPEANTDGFSPAADIDEANEARRRDQIARQLDLNLQMNWFSGYGPQCLDAFEPWQSVPGDIWGYPRPRPIEQPIGHESAQTGPNRWIYRPLYAEPAELPGPDRRNPAALNGVGPQLPGPADLAPDAKPPAGRLMKMKKRPPGPREF